MAQDEKPSRGSQVNIRLAGPEADVLHAIAFLEERPAADVLRPVVTEFLNRRKADSEVVDALAVLARRRARG